MINEQKYFYLGRWLRHRNRLGIYTQKGSKRRDLLILHHVFHNILWKQSIYNNPSEHSYFITFYKETSSKEGYLLLMNSWKALTNNGRFLLQQDDDVIAELAAGYLLSQQGTRRLAVLKEPTEPMATISSLSVTQKLDKHSSVLLGWQINSYKNATNYLFTINSFQKKPSHRGKNPQKQNSYFYLRKLQILGAKYENGYSFLGKSTVSISDTYNTILRRLWVLCLSG